MLGHLQAAIGQVEHLAHLSAGNLRPSQALPATGAAHRRVHDCAVGAVDLCQRCPGRAGLLARTAPYPFAQELLGSSRARRRRSARDSRSSACFARSPRVSDEGGLPELEELRPISRFSFSSSASSASNFAPQFSVLCPELANFGPQRGVLPFELLDLFGKAHAIMSTMPRALSGGQSRAPRALQVNSYDARPHRPRCEPAQRGSSSDARQVTSTSDLCAKPSTARSSDASRSRPPRTDNFGKNLNLNAGFNALDERRISRNAQSQVGTSSSWPTRSRGDGHPETVRNRFVSGMTTPQGEPCRISRP